MILGMAFLSALGKMKNKDILITLNNWQDKEELEKLGIKHFVYPLKGFCVGMPNTFLLEEIPKDGYIFINRILDNKGIDDLKKLIKGVTQKGLIFDDLGVLQIVKNLKMEKILYLSHFNTNSESIKLYLEYVDSVIVATDITENEIKEIVTLLPHKLTLFILGYVGSMYSRRLLIDNYCQFHKIKKENPLYISKDDKGFILYENEYGTMFYHNKIFNGLQLLDLDAKYYFINAPFLNAHDIKDLIDETSKLPQDKGFLETETIYKLKGEAND